MSSKHFGDSMSDGVSSFSSPLFSEVNALERTTAQEIDSGLGFTSLGYAFMSSEYFIDPTNDGLLVQQSTFSGLGRMTVHEVDATRSRSKGKVNVMGLGTDVGKLGT